jgi:hypothetical protein
MTAIHGLTFLEPGDFLCLKNAFEAACDGFVLSEDERNMLAIALLNEYARGERDKLRLSILARRRAHIRVVSRRLSA